MELMDETASRKLKTPYIAEGAFLMDGGLLVGDDHLREALPLYAFRDGRATVLDTCLHRWRDATIVRTALAFLDKVSGRFPFWERSTY
jgi:hypothetical protein